MEEDEDRDKNDLKVLLTLEQKRKLFFIGIAGFIILIVFGWIYEIIYPPPPSTLDKATEMHFQAIVGIPLSAIFAIFVVKLLKQKSGKMEITGLGISFKGASGEVILWLICFLSIIGAIKMIW